MVMQTPVNIERKKLVELTMADVVSVDVDWLWRNWLARGHLHVIAGDPDVGKSFLTCELAAIVSSGRDWPDGSINDAPGDVFMLVGEDDIGHTVRPRLDAHDADVNRIHAFADTKILRGDRSDLHEAILRHADLTLIIIDTLNDFVEIGDGNSNQDARDGMAGILALAKRHNVAVVLVTHTPKRDGKYSRRAIDSVLGARSLSAMPRFVYAVGKHPQDKNLRVLVPIKANLVERKVAMAFEILEGRLKWQSTALDLTADDLFTSKRGPAPERLRECTEWIKSTLVEDAWTSSTCFESLAKEAEFNVPMVRRAKKTLGIVSKFFHKRWYCRLPSAVGQPLPLPPEKPVQSDGTSADAQPEQQQVT